MLTQGQIAQYHEDGYIVPDFQMPPEVLESIKARHAALLAGHPEFRDYCPALFDHDIGFADYGANREILDMVEQLIGGDIALWNMSFFAKPAGNGKRTPWHQDGEYWPIRPLATCTAWLAVDDSTVENGCLRVHLLKVWSLLKSRGDSVGQTWGFATTRRWNRSTAH